MATLSDKLRNITAQAEQQTAVGGASNTLQTQQALTQSQGRAGQGNIRQTAQQMAPAIGQAQGAVGQQVQQQAGQAAIGAIQQENGKGLATQRQQLQNEQMYSDDDIARQQRQGKLKQNDAELKQAKQMQAEDIAAQKRMQQTGFEFNNKISFLTRKQREDLAAMGRYVKQQVHDSRLQFGADERGRKFSNMRQLADYAAASAVDEQDLKIRLREMKQASDKEQIMFEAAGQKIVQRIEAEFQKGEQEKDQQLIRQLAEMKRNLEAEQRRKAAKSQATTSIIVGAATIAGAVIGGYFTAGTGTAAGASAGAAVGAGLGQAISGGAQSQGAY